MALFGLTGRNSARRLCGADPRSLAGHFYRAGEADQGVGVRQDGILRRIGNAPAGTQTGRPAAHGTMIDARPEALQTARVNVGAATLRL